MQDSASQLIAPLIGAKAGERILDSCAAPGGKTSHLCALMNNEVRIVAVDTDGGRLAEMSENLARLGARCAEPVRGDASDAEWLKSLGPFDRALVDAPCTNLGVLRRNPEVKRRTGPRAPLLFHEGQSQLLKAAAQALVTGGVVVYSVCTVSEEETVNVVNRFLRENPWLEAVPIHDENPAIKRFVGCDGFLRTFPPPQDCPLDGFFAAKLRKISEPRSR